MPRHAIAKTEMLQLRLMQQRKELVRMDEVMHDDRQHDGRGADGDVEHARTCAPRGDIAVRRAIEKVVFEVRTDLAEIAQRKADKAGEPVEPDA